MCGVEECVSPAGLPGGHRLEGAHVVQPHGGGVLGVAAGAEDGGETRQIRVGQTQLALGQRGGRHAGVRVDPRALAHDAEGALVDLAVEVRGSVRPLPLGGSGGVDVDGLAQAAEELPASAIRVDAQQTKLDERPGRAGRLSFFVYRLTKPLRLYLN